MKGVARPGTKPRIDEDLFRPRNLEEARQLRRALVEAGVSAARAWTVIGWLLDPEHIDGMPQATASVRRSEYRSVLLRLGEPPWERERASVGSRDKGA